GPRQGAWTGARSTPYSPADRVVLSHRQENHRVTMGGIPADDQAADFVSAQHARGAARSRRAGRTAVQLPQGGCQSCVRPCLISTGAAPHVALVGSFTQRGQIDIGRRRRWLRINAEGLGGGSGQYLGPADSDAAWWRVAGECCAGIRAIEEIPVGR